MSQRWSLETLNWSQFDATLVDPEVLAVVKTASLVEARAADYVTYLCNVFVDDPDFLAAIAQWGREERMHGAALAQWAQRADPQFDFEAALAAFCKGFPLPVETAHSIRGSRAGELIARQIVETGTSSFYSAIRDAAREPVLKDIAHRIAQDEFFHYQLFRNHYTRYQKVAPLSLWEKIKIAVTRFQEGDDDELGYAYFAANVLPYNPNADYAAHDYGAEYWARALKWYRRAHTDAALRMLLRAIEWAPNGRAFKILARPFWQFVTYQARKRVPLIPV